MGIIPRNYRHVNPVYRVILVRPSADFQPTNWRNRPGSFDVLYTAIADTFSRGEVDAYRFLHNQRQCAAGIKTWAILETVK